MASIIRNTGKRDIPFDDTYIYDLAEMSEEELKEHYKERIEEMMKEGAE
ncbi:MAG: hypothetical protein JRC86_08720 [Deltaproteobacteria bacterium]|nr:hypothetical protein [Deltaproteobacteria bacterium]